MARPYDDKQLKKSEEDEPNQSKKKMDKSRAITSPAKEQCHSREESEGKSPARSVRSMSSERPKRERSSTSRDDFKHIREAEAKETEDAHNQSEEDLKGMRVVGEQIDDEHSDLPPDLRYCITLDEVNDSEEAEAEAEAEEEEEDEDSPRVIYIGNLPLCKFSDPQFIKMVKQVFRPVRYFINRQQRMGLVEFKNRHEARGFVAKMQNHNFGGSPIDVFISNKYNRLPWGRGVEYDEFGRIMRHFRVGSSPQRDGNRFLHNQLEGNRSSHKYPQIEVTRSPQRSRCRSMDRSGGKSRDRSRGKSRGRSGEKSKDRHSPKSAEQSRESDQKDAWKKSKSPPQEKPPPMDESQAVKEDSVTAGINEEGIVVHQDMCGQEDGQSQTLKIECVVSLNSKDLEEQEQELTGNAEREKVAESKEQESKVVGVPEHKVRVEECDNQAAGSRSEGGKAVKRKGDGGEPGAEKRLKQEDKQDSMTTEDGAAGPRIPSKPVGTEFILFYCDSCHVKFSDEQEARVTHCSSREHYLKYQEVTGIDPWSV